MPPKHWRKKKDAGPHIGKLMIVLRNRHVVWIDMGPEDGKAMRAKIHRSMITGYDTEIDGPYRYASVIDLAPYSQDTVRIEDIVHVRYIGPRSAGTAPEATQES